MASHDAAFGERAGEILFGYQPLATQEARAFERAAGFAGAALLRHVVCSNEPDTESTMTEKKQCTGKDFVVPVAHLLLVELFLRYDSFEDEVGSLL